MSRLSALVLRSLTFLRKLRHFPRRSDSYRPLTSETGYEESLKSSSSSHKSMCEYLGNIAINPEDGWVELCKALERELKELALSDSV
jgi:hypothetical protein